METVNNIASALHGADLSTIFDGVKSVEGDMKEKFEKLAEARAVSGSVSASQVEAIKEQLAAMKTKTKVREYHKIGRNDPCPCGSGKKYKNCCLNSGKYELLVDKK